MVVIGSDVVNLYPSLDISRVVENVKIAVQESNISWSNLDYLEGCRYIALNWSEQACRSSKLRRVLPYRRKNKGSRPGLRGELPQGPHRGDTEQWIFPRVKLTPEEKQLIIATVVQIATEAMFRKHFYEFGDQQFQQR